MDWCFAKINNRLAEIYFEEKRGKLKILGHCCVKKTEYKTKSELKWIAEDTKKFRLIYKNGKYRQIKKIGRRLITMPKNSTNYEVYSRKEFRAMLQDDKLPQTLMRKIKKIHH